MTKRGANLSTHRRVCPFPPQEILDKSKFIGEQFRPQASYEKILHALQTNISNPKSIFLLDDYMGESFPGLRKAFPNSHITSFNPRIVDFTDKNSLLACGLADAYGIRMIAERDMVFYDLQETRRLFGNPSLLICRGPRVIEQTGNTFQSFNTGVIDSLTEWFKYMSDMRAPMVMTFLVEDEAKAVSDAVEQSGQEIFYYRNPGETPVYLDYERPYSIESATPDKIVVSSIPLDFSR